ncbi:MAG: hypothetical protein R3F20_02250 [Planctomycetota bacterium]
MAGADAPGVSLVLPVTIVRHMVDESARATFDEIVSGEPDRMPFVALHPTGHDIRFLPGPE